MAIKSASAINIVVVTSSNRKQARHVCDGLLSLSTYLSQFPSVVAAFYPGFGLHLTISQRRNLTGIVHQTSDSLVKGLGFAFEILKLLYEILEFS